MIEVEVRKLEPMKVAYVRHTGPYMECGTAWEKLMGWAGPKGLCGPQTRCLGICYDNPDTTPAGNIRYDACITLDRELAPEPPVQVQEIPGGEYAVGTHVGSYSNLKQTWQYLLGEWLPASGRELRRSPPFEVYCNNPQTTPEDQLRVEIHLPLA